jgi:hypothetical protein
VAQPIPPQAPAVGASSRVDRRDKGPLRIATPDESEEQTDEETDVNVYLNE